MRIVCLGWYDKDNVKVHTEPRVMRDDGRGGPDSHTCCIPCRDAFLERADAARAAKEAAK